MYLTSDGKLVEFIVLSVIFVVLDPKYDAANAFEVCGNSGIVADIINGYCGIYVTGYPNQDKNVCYNCGKPGYYLRDCCELHKSI